jgi:5S rRNA maturation endonuclease (ribonuclease M5)
MNKSLLYLLARTGLLDKDRVDHAAEGDALLRAQCPVHQGADNVTSFVVGTDRWFCNTHKCHDAYGGRLEGLVVALADRHAGPRLRPRTDRGLPTFGAALAWLRREAGRLRAVHAEWPSAPTFGSGPVRGRSTPFACTREAAIDSLGGPAWHFLGRGFSPDTLRRHAIADPLRRGVFAHLRGYAVVPLFDPDDPGRCAGYAARSTRSHEPVRWKMSPGLPNGQRLFHFEAARLASARTRRVLLVEGVADALRCEEAGFDDVVAVLGSNLLGEQAERLARLRLRDVVVVADNDAAGAGFAHQVRCKLATHAGAVRVLNPPAGAKDIADLTTAAAQPFLAAHIRPYSGTAHHTSNV